MIHGVMGGPSHSSQKYGEFKMEKGIFAREK
jgi:hypothetical protein